MSLSVSAQVVALAFVPKPRLCRFCGDLATFDCCWPVVKPVEAVSVASLAVGDWIYPCKVAAEPCEISRIDTEFADIGCYVIYLAGGSGSLRRLGTDLLYIPVKNTCGNACCYRHARQPDEGRNYCRDHWRQEEVA